MGSIQLNLYSREFSFFSFMFNASEDLLWYGLAAPEPCDAGLAFSSLTSAPFGTGFFEVKGIRNGGMLKGGMWGIDYWIRAMF